MTNVVRDTCDGGRRAQARERTNADRFPDRARPLSPLEARRRRPRRDADHGRRRGGRPVPGLRAQAQLLRPRRRHRARRRGAAPALRASGGTRVVLALRQAEGLLRRRQHPHAGRRDPWPQGELLQVHQRDAATASRTPSAALRPGARSARDQRHRGRRRLRAGAGLRPHHAGRRPLAPRCRCPSCRCSPCCRAPAG